MGEAHEPGTGQEDALLAEADAPTELHLRLLTAAVQAQSLDEMLREVYEVLGTPAVLIDGTMRLAAHWPHGTDPGDADWSSVVSSGFVNERFAEITQRGQQGPGSPAIQMVRHYDATADELPKYRCTIVSSHGGVSAGLMLLEQAGPLDETRRGLLPCVCQAVANVMDKHGFSGSGRVDQLGSLLAAIEDGEVGDPSQVEELLARQGVQVEPPFVAVRWGIPRGRDMYAPYWRRLANERIGACVGHGGEALLGVVGVGREGAYRRLLDAATAFGQATGLSCGVSATGATLAQLADRMHEASGAYRVGMEAAPSRLVHEYADHACDLLLRQGAVHGYLAHHPDPRIAALRAHDAAHSTDYVEVLAAYLSNFNNLSRTAQARGQHRNTLAYQVRQIGLVMGCDLDDPHVAFSLHVMLEAEQAGNASAARR